MSRYSLNMGWGPSYVRRVKINLFHHCHHHDHQDHHHHHYHHRWAGDQATTGSRSRTILWRSKGKGALTLGVIFMMMMIIIMMMMIIMIMIMIQQIVTKYY